MTFSPPHLLDGARWAGLRVGLLGGSFNPPHEGHVHVSLVALQSLKLDFIWWLLTPGNPLKDTGELASYGGRLEQCRLLTHDYPHLLVSDLEEHLGITRSYDTVRALRLAFPRTDFVWITGMDNALTFHHWHNWRYILKEMATAHIARPPALTLIEQCPLRMVSTQHHHYVHKPEKAILRPGHTYWLLQRKMLGASSTALRDQAVPPQTANGL